MNVLADIDAVDDEGAFNDNFTLNIRRLTAAGGETRISQIRVTSSKGFNS